MTSIDENGNWTWGDVESYLSVVSTESEFYEKKCVFQEEIRNNTNSTEHNDEIISELD